MKPILAFILIGIFAFIISTGTVLASAVSENMLFVFSLMLLLTLLLSINLNIGFYLFFSLILFFEEFPSEITEYMRWMRTSFYAKSIFIKGLYLFDVILILLLFFMFFNFVVRRKKFAVFKNNIFLLPLGLLFLLMIVSVVISLAVNPGFMEVAYDLSSLPTTMTMEVARLIGFVQVKVFMYFFISFFIALLTFDAKRKITVFLYFLLAVISASLIQGLIRFILNPSGYLTNIAPLFYDTASSFYFVVYPFLLFSFIFFGIHREIYFKSCALFFVILALMCIVFSFRRAVWGAMAIATATYFFLLPRKAKVIYISFFGIIGLLVVLFFLMHGGYDLASRAIEGRIQQTSLSETSTVYRLTLFMNMPAVAARTPLLGYGILPLWNYSIEWRNLITNLENIHSLYFWLLLRFGVFGLLLFIWFLAKAIKYSFRIYADSHDNILKTAGITFLLAFVTFIVVSLTTPTYGEVRFMVFLGVTSGIVANIYSMMRSGVIKDEK